MKIVLTASVIALAAASNFDWGPPEYMRSPLESIVSVQPYHATRIHVTCKRENGSLHQYNVHHTNSLTCGKDTLYASDYLTGKKAFGPYQPM
ncbi:hypothetical protein H6504_04370 [Candidatus Woesearchaeota archaeon]|nr:hypothetical protein [Candidatus Woesearchaeota archaeon]